MAQSLKFLIGCRYTHVFHVTELLLMFVLLQSNRDAQLELSDMV